MGVVAVAVVLVAVVVLVAGRDGGGPGPGTPVSPSSTRAPAPSTSGAPTTTSPVTLPPTTAPFTQPKPVLTGLLDRQRQPPPEFVDVLGGWVVNVDWAELQPEPGGPLDTGAIDEALARVRALNGSRSGEPLGLKLRVFAGIHAPAWAKQLGGPPYAIPSVGATAPRFWTDEFGAAYQSLMEALSARYDAAPELLDVVIARCTTEFAEPFIRQRSDREAVAGLLAAGFTVAADRRCHEEQIATHQVWARTRSSLALNPYQDVTAPPGQPDVQFTLDMLDRCRAVLGQRCVLANNSIRVPMKDGPDYERLYGAIQAAGPPIIFQTATIEKVGDLEATLAWAVTQGASAVELPGAYRRMAAADFAVFGPALAAVDTAG